MGALELIAGIVGLAIDTYNRISAHHQAGAGMTVEQFITAALTQTEENEKIHAEIIAEAMRQKGQTAAARTIEANLKEIGKLAKQLAKVDLPTT